MRFNFALLLLAVLLTSVACRQTDDDTPPPPPVLETEEVGAPDAIDPDQDPRATARRSSGPQLRGVLPSDFPQDLPVALPASIVDLSGDAEGERLVSFAAFGVSQSSLRNDLLARLAGAGWQIDESASGSWQLSKDGRRATLRIDKDGPTAQFHYQY
ncbi:MAG: hypothetical protein AAGD38_10315 [Acidobacteriota bacterium]